MSEGRVELAREGFDAWNRRDRGWMRDNATADFEFEPAIAAAVEGGSVKGIDAVIGFLENLDETWESFQLAPEEFRGVGEQILMPGRIFAKGRGSGVELAQPMASVFWFRDGRISRMESFPDVDEATEAAGSGKTP